VVFRPVIVRRARRRYRVQVMGLVATAVGVVGLAVLVAADPPAAAVAAPMASSPAAPSAWIPRAQTPAEAPDRDLSGPVMAPPPVDDEKERGRVVDPEPPELTTVGVQQRLRRLGYLIGPANGDAGQQTKAAVMAFQRVQGLEVDGVVGPVTAEALRDDPIEPTLAGGPDDRIEVDLDRQLVHVIEDGDRRATLHASSGSGIEYVASSGNETTARTPVGEFVVERRIPGVREANLGVLHDPVYFHRGFAIHGSPSVPVQPASLGCVRITIADGAWLIDHVSDGMPVHLYGGEHVYTPPGPG
jgi:peptidoglycan hydrolase-like protein with peptidoglycan-binding domain